MTNESTEVEQGQGARSARSLGYIYYNPDTGVEWSKNHPVTSGECPDAQEIKRATSAALLEELLLAWEAWAQDRDELDTVRGAFFDASTDADKLRSVLNDAIPHIGVGYSAEQRFNILKPVRAALGGGCHDADR